MKRIMLASAVALAAFSSPSFSQQAPDYENWIGGFYQYYSPDSNKPMDLSYLDDGDTFGAEMGFRFDNNYAVRFELSRIFLDMEGPNAPGSGDDGTMLGADLMYFLDDESLYFFGGLREQSIADSYRMLSYGVGKHWAMTDTLRLISEVTAYRDLGQRYDDFSVKLGVAYIFGENSGITRQTDSDNDGVYDAVDRCPNSARGAVVDATGCNVDLDADGVLNSVDQCPNTPAGNKVNANGCAMKDADMDGIADAVDTCPNTPAGDEVNAKGCSIELDMDNDGVLDSRDKCVNTPMSDKVDKDGCSVMVQKEVSIAIDLLFANNSSIIENPDSAEIIKFVEFMQRYGNTDAVIEGHTSAVGSAEYNQFLSNKRAQSFKTLLVDRYDIDASRLKAVGYGETQLRDSSGTAAAHKVNRRIEVKVTAKVETTATR